MTDARASLPKWLELRGGSLEDFAFPSRTDHAAHMSTRQYARLVKATGNLRAVQILLWHTKIESTVRYLGVDVEDALTLAEGTEI